MPKYIVTLTETVKYFVEIEAASKDEAEADAVEAWNHSEDPFGDFRGEGQGVDVYLTLKSSI